MIYSFCFLFVLYFIYSFIGYVVEVLKVSYSKHRWIFSRGYLVGPYLPIFGVAAVLMVYFLQIYQSDVLVLFTMSLTICCLLEYFTSLILEKIYNLRWWDYSYKKYHINGRVCLENGILFGIAGVVLVRYMHPFFVSILQMLSPHTMIVLGIILAVIMGTDFLLSTTVILQIKNELQDVNERDSTEHVRKKVKETVQYQFFHSRFFTAFPDVLTNRKLRKKESSDSK